MNQEGLSRVCPCVLSFSYSKQALPTNLRIITWQNVVQSQTTDFGKFARQLVPAAAVDVNHASSTSTESIH